MSKCRVVVLFGGVSEEHDISVKSAGEIAKSINKNIYEVIFIGITKKGEWKLCDSPKQGWEKDAKVTAIISPDRMQRGILLFEEDNVRICPVDVIYPVMHGKMGEDGQVQGLLEMSGLPYVGCGIEASVIGMDKALTHLVAQKVNVATPKFWVVDVTKGEEVPKLKYPVFVKPARSGSSFGVTKVERESELKAAIKEAAKYDKKVIVEEAITGVEIGCAVMGNQEEVITGEVDMICLSHGFFRIHQEENPEGGSTNAIIQAPAPISEAVADKVKETAKTIYKGMGCEGLARVDLFLKEDETVVLNEVNTMPGCTCYSRYPRMMQASGMKMEEMVDRLIQLALARNYEE